MAQQLGILAALLKDPGCFLLLDEIIWFSLSFYNDSHFEFTVMIVKSPL